MTFCLKGTARKGKLGSSPDGLNLFRIFLHIYIDMNIYVCISTQINVCTHTFEFLRTKVQEVEITLNK